MNVPHPQSTSTNFLAYFNISLSHIFKQKECYKISRQSKTIMQKDLHSGYLLTLGNCSVLGLLILQVGGEGSSLHLVAQPRMGEATPPLSHLPLWHAHGQLISNNFYMVLYILYYTFLYMITQCTMGDDFFTLYLVVSTVCVRTVVKFITGWWCGGTTAAGAVAYT